MVYAREQIQYIVDRVMQNYGNSQLPVDLEMIAHKLDLSIWTVDLHSIFKRDDVSGAIYKDEKKIYVHENDSFERKRFSIAHEIGHYVLHYNGPEGYGFDEKEERHVSFRDNRSKSGFDTKEVEANYFAACLLMPEKQMKEYYNNNISTYEMAQALAVSETAVMVRLESLGLI